MEKSCIKLDVNQLLFSASRALDAVEEEVLGASQNHSRRVAYLSVILGRRLGMNDKELNDIAVYASLHDNALTEYVLSQRRKGVDLPLSKIRDDFRYHCEVGEENARKFPVHSGQKDIIKYHHENYDGTGLYGLKGDQTPVMAQIIRIADQADVRFRLSRWNNDTLDQLAEYLKTKSGHWFAPSLAEEFFHIFDEDVAHHLADPCIEQSLSEVIPVRKIMVPYEDLTRISALYAHIIDYKSPFTMRHSTGIAEKTRKMARYYEFEDRVYYEICNAAYLHDIGKLAVPDALLEKPGKLTLQEYEVVKEHVRRTHVILSAIDSFDRIDLWASSHHERLDGSGYFRGSTGDSQDFCSRLLACIDMYQALVEDRPYRSGMEHDRAMSIMKEEVERGKLDGKVVSDIGRQLKDI